MWMWMLFVNVGCGDVGCWSGVRTPLRIGPGTAVGQATLCCRD
jgi:hypothetical protein